MGDRHSTFFVLKRCRTQYGFYIPSTSQCRLATFQVLSSNMWVVATLLENAGLSQHNSLKIKVNIFPSDFTFLRSTVSWAKQKAGLHDI